VKPWVPEIDVDDKLARRLVAIQFPSFAQASIRRIGSGWDNAAYLVEEHLIFRFPQRSIAAPLMVKELANLPLLAPHLPIPIPLPVWAGRPHGEYPWHFGGYEILLGASANSRELSDDDRCRLASDLGRFLRALHDVDPKPLLEAGLPLDDIGKLDPQRLGVGEAPLEGEERVVHGDLYALHLLLDPENRLCGVIDWGDLHYGLPAVDLAVAHLMVPPHLHDAFLAAYGAVDDRTWRFARYRARHHCGYALEYAVARGDRDLQRACEIAWGYISA
jgi:aminoglycoside phosphotransferase (APT) family kinase protein